MNKQSAIKLDDVTLPVLMTRTGNGFFLRTELATGKTDDGIEFEISQNMGGGALLLRVKTGPKNWITYSLTLQSFADVVIKHYQESKSR